MWGSSSKTPGTDNRLLTGQKPAHLIAFPRFLFKRPITTNVEIPWGYGPAQIIRIEREIIVIVANS